MKTNAAASSSSALRTRAYRQRRRAGATLVQLNITADGARALQQLGWLATGAIDPKAIGEAVLALGNEAVKMRLRCPATTRDETSNGRSK